MSFTSQSSPVDVTRALDQIAEIHQQIAKAEVYRGYRSVPLAFSGAIGLAAAWLQPLDLGSTDPQEFLVYWTVIAAAAAFVGSSEILYNYLVREPAAGRRRTRQVVGQFLPSLMAGALIAIFFVRRDPALVALLPGIWALCFATGTLASRPYLPRASTIVGGYYFLAGVALLSAAGARSLTGWWIGGTFGAGQLLAAVVLWWTLERTPNH
jgi:hypothetical protein